MEDDYAVEHTLFKDTQLHPMFLYQLLLIKPVFMYGTLGTSHISADGFFCAIENVNIFLYLSCSFVFMSKTCNTELSAVLYE